MKLKRYFILVISILLVVVLVFSGLTLFRQKNPTNMHEISEEKPYLFPAYVFDKNNKRWGYINNLGEFIIEPQFDGATDFNNKGLAVVWDKGYYGVINKKAEYIAKPKYNYIVDIYDGIIIGQIKQYYYDFIDQNGNIVNQLKGYVGSFSEGLGIYSNTNDWENMRYGFVDIYGNVVIAPQYLSVTNFNNNMAVAKVKDNNFVVIDSKGSIITTIYEDIVGEISEGILIYRDSRTKKEGYMTLAGEKITEAEFIDAKPFNNGYAEVMVLSGSNSYRAGLINKKGKYVIKPKYGGAQVIGKNLFAVSPSTSYLFSSWNEYIPKAIINRRGKLKSEYIYYNFGKIDDRLYYFSDGVYTYLSNRKFKPLSKYPKLYGVGKITAFGDVLKIELDDDLLYMTKDGKKIWKSEYKFPLWNGATVMEIKYRPDRYNLIYYPKIVGMAESEIEKKINRNLENIFTEHKDRKDDGVLNYEIYSRRFQVEEFKQLITIVEEGYYYPLGAAHGVPWIKSYPINIHTGDMYKLEDLFIENSKYKAKLQAIIKRQMIQQNKKDQTYFEDVVPKITDEQFFLLTEKGLEIRFQVYEIASYAVGMPSFIIPYEEITKIINFDSDLWNLVK